MSQKHLSGYDIALFVRISRIDSQMGKKQQKDYMYKMCKFNPLPLQRLKGGERKALGMSKRHIIPGDYSATLSAKIGRMRQDHDEGKLGLTQ